MLCHSLFWCSTGNALFWGRLVKPGLNDIPAPFLTAKPNLFLLLEPFSFPLQEIRNPLLLRFVLFGLRADFSISSSYRLISTPNPHSPAADSLPDSNYAPVGAYVFQEVLLSTPKFPTLLYGFIFLLSLSFLKLLIFFSSLFFPYKSMGFSLLVSTFYMIVFEQISL